MAENKTLDIVSTGLVFASFVGFFWWMGMIVQAKGEEKLDVACHPIEIVTEGAQSVTTALVGFTPNWPLEVRKFLQGGCYYFFSIVLRSGETGAEYNRVGGVRVE